jgi:hypothetical protein
LTTWQHIAAGAADEARAILREEARADRHSVLRDITIGDLIVFLFKLMIASVLLAVPIFLIYLILGLINSASRP